ncbi:MAG: hypothetical protein AAFY41_10550, partial [Bacteroidota bacterium]
MGDYPSAPLQGHKRAFSLIDNHDARLAMGRSITEVLRQSVGWRYPEPAASNNQKVSLLHGSPSLGPNILRYGFA